MPRLLICHRLSVSGGEVSFARAGFSGGTVLLTRVGHPLAAFHRANFSNSPVVFDGAGFSGDEVSLKHSWHWAHPPRFSWDGKPQLGVAAAADLQGMELISINPR